MISLIIVIAVLGLAAWVVTLLPIPAPFNRIIQVVLIIIAVIYVLSFLLGLGGGSLGAPVIVR